MVTKDDSPTRSDAVASDISFANDSSTRRPAHMEMEPNEMPKDDSMDNFSVSSTGEISQQTFDDFSVTSSIHLFRPQNSSSLLFNLSKSTGPIVKHKIFKRIVILLITLNSIITGIGTFDFVIYNPHLDVWYLASRSFFLAIFTVEILFKIAHHQLACLMDGWLLFDIFVVTMSWIHPSVLIVRLFRVVRTLRLASHVKALRYVVRSLLKAIPQMLALTFLTSILFFIFSVVCTSLFKDLYARGFTSQDYFSRIDKTGYTLFRIMTLDNWSSVTKEVMAVYTWAWIPIIFFIMLSSFGIIKVAIAVLCEAMAEVQREMYLDYMAGIQDSIVAPTKETANHIAKLEKKVDDLTSIVNHLIDNEMLRRREDGLLKFPERRSENRLPTMTIRPGESMTRFT